MSVVTVLTNAGRAYITALLIAQTTYGAWGTGATVAAATATSLSTESPDEARVATTNTQQTTSAASDTIRYEWTQTCAVGGKTITNMGVFSALTVGTLIELTDSIATTVAVGDSIKMDLSLQF